VRFKGTVPLEKRIRVLESSVPAMTLTLIFLPRAITGLFADGLMFLIGSVSAAPNEQ
jgi:hypothetical protein